MASGWCAAASSPPWLSNRRLIRRLCGALEMAIADADGNRAGGRPEILSRWCATQPPGRAGKIAGLGRKAAARCCGVCKQDGDHRVVPRRAERTAILKILLGLASPTRGAGPEHTSTRRSASRPAEINPSENLIAGHPAQGSGPDSNLEPIAPWRPDPELCPRLPAAPVRTPLFRVDHAPAPDWEKRPW